MEIVRILELNENNQTKNLNTYLNIYPGYFYGFQIQKERRLHSIRLRTSQDTWNSFKKAVVIFQAWYNDPSKFEDFNVSRTNRQLNYSSSFVLTGYSESYNFKNFRFESNEWFRIYEIALFAYHDECGYPEVPLHGHVQFEPGDTKAIYLCDDGYHLASNISIRHCIQGQWNGSQPICTK